MAYVHCFLPWLACVCTFWAATDLFLNPMTHVYLQKLVQPKNKNWCAFGSSKSFKIAKPFGFSYFF